MNLGSCNGARKMKLFTICDMFILCGSEEFIISLAVYDIQLPALQNGPLPLPSSSKTAN